MYYNTVVPLFSSILHYKYTSRRVLTRIKLVVWILPKKCARCQFLRSEILFSERQVHNLTDSTTHLAD